MSLPENAVRPCYGCGNYFNEAQLNPIDVSRDDQYYPEFIYVCPGCDRGGPE